MSVTIIVGAQWGDEGKGKIVDYLTEGVDYVVRFQGGNNAGHTVIIGDQRFALKLIPSGVLRPHTRCLLAAGVVVNLEAFFEELQGLESLGVDVSPERLGISGAAPVVMPYHRAFDLAREDRRADKKIGTTGRGIGPAYEDAVSRSGIRVSDIFDDKNLEFLVERNVETKNRYLRTVLESDQKFCAREVLDGLRAVREKLQPYVTNVSREIQGAIAKGQDLLFEGAQGCLLDVTHGTYPYVTSSNTIAGYACVAGGFGPQHVDFVLGISKAYCTRVGEGPFPTQEDSELADTLRERGGEFGTVTGRPRRCGWFDVVAARRAVRLNGINSLVLTKLDVLSGFDTVRLGVSYELDGTEIDDLPASHLDVARVRARYEEHPGWPEEISDVQSFDGLPENAKSLVKRIEELVECEIGGVSVGPERSQMMLLNDSLSKFFK